MKTSFYIMLFFLAICLFPAEAQTAVYQGLVNVKQNAAELREGSLYLNMDISLSGFSIGRYQTLRLVPVLRNGSEVVRLQPVVINGINKQKMYNRTLAFKGKVIANDGAYIVLKCDPSLYQEVSYEKEIPFHPWMENAEFILVGELTNYNGVPEQTIVNVLTDHLKIKKGL